MTSRTVTDLFCRPKAAGCKTGLTRLPQSLADIIADYRQKVVPRERAEQKYFGDKSTSVRASIRRAALSLLPDGKIHDHQRRLGKGKMAQCADILEGYEQLIIAVTDFETLHSVIKTGLRTIFFEPGLAAYDIAVRIGWRLGIEPDAVYLHRGTRDGARILRPNLRGEKVSVGVLAAELCGLSPDQVESLLCIYKRDLQRLRDKNLL